MDPLRQPDGEFNVLTDPTNKNDLTGADRLHLRLESATRKRPI